MKNRHHRGRNAVKGTFGRAAGIILSVGLLLSSAAFSFGETWKPRGMWGFTLGGIFPEGAFNDHVDRDGYAVSFYYNWRAGNAPVFLGAELSLDYYGHTHRHEYFVGIPEVRVDVDTYNYITQGLFFLRFQPGRGDLRPFVEGLAGISYMFTQTSISGHDYPWDEISSDVNYDYVTWAAGIGAGLAVLLHSKNEADSGERRNETSLDFKIRYMAGAKARYMKEGSIVIVDDTVVYTFERSATSFITFQAGITFSF